jgi:DNA mismatch repair ATPase MutL
MVHADDLPSLDDLLDLDVPKPQKPQSKEDKPIDPADLTPDQAKNALERAVGSMQKVATKMGDDRDVSLSLQRSQEEIIKDLDQVIAAAKKQQQKQSSSSSSSSSSKQQDQQDQQQNSTKQNSAQRSDSQKGNTQQQSQSQQSKSQKGDPADVAGEMKTMQPGDKTQPIESGKTEWGNLPPRLRDELMQGTQERFSPVYEKQTEAYYRRLAEEAK